ncbi:MAG: hypothetical protein GY856_33870 [bacterium]|nr:hypothetical protein [bacterium]
MIHSKNTIRRTTLLLAILAAAAASGGAAPADHTPAREAVAEKSGGDCGWTSDFALRDIDGRVTAMAVYDDGSGPALYVGGEFTAAGDVVVNNIAKWDGRQWSALSGPAGTGTDWGYVHALAVYDDGGGEALYVGGDFRYAGGLTVRGTAKWDGTGWSALSDPTGTIFDFSVYALAVYDDGSGPALYAGGSFHYAEGVEWNNIAKWDGTQWSTLSGPAGTGTEGRVHALAVYDDGNGAALYAGGDFTKNVYLPSPNLERWDGTEWSSIYGTSSEVLALVVYDDGSGPALYIGGEFYNLKIYDGSEWPSVLSGPSGIVRTLAVYDDGGGPALYAGGEFTHAGDVELNHVAKWDGTAFSVLSGPSGTGTNDSVAALAVYDDGNGPELYAGGKFTVAGGGLVNRIAKWDGTAFSVLSGAAGNGLDYDVGALAVYDDGSGPALYAGGGFILAGEEVVNYVAKWDGTTWSSLSGPSGTGMDARVKSLVVYDDGSGPALYAGGLFTTAGGVVAEHIAKWDGTQWSAFSGLSGAVFSDSVEALAVYDDGSGPALYAGGRFGLAGDVTANNIAKWDGTQWSALSGPSDNGLSSSVEALAVYDDGSGPELYVGGSFDHAGGVPALSIAKWDGTAFSALGGVCGDVEELAVWDDGSGPALYVGGWFDTAGGVAANGIARWDGSAYSALSGPSGYGVDEYPIGAVEALAVYDGDSGPALYAGGWFASAGGVAADNIAQWDGSAFSSLSGPSAPGDHVYALAVYDDGNGPALYVGGRFQQAGGLASSYLGRWRCPRLVEIFADGFDGGDTSAWSQARH